MRVDQEQSFLLGLGHVLPHGKLTPEVSSGLVLFEGQLDLLCVG